MPRPTILWGLAIVFLTGCSQPTPPLSAKAASREEAAAAWQRQDYATAERLYRALAQQGDPSAQHFLGKMYDNGEGVGQDSAEAAKWFRLAAEQGHTGAQFYLGNLYANGKGVPQDYVQAYMWYDLSTSGPEAFYAVANRSAVADKMTPAQISRAQSQVSAWKAKHGQQ
jgi:TPR repeat protein